MTQKSDQGAIKQCTAPLSLNVDNMGICELGVVDVPPTFRPEIPPQGGVSGDAESINSENPSSAE